MRRLTITTTLLLLSSSAHADGRGWDDLGFLGGFGVMPAIVVFVLLAARRSGAKVLAAYVIGLILSTIVFCIVWTLLGSDGVYLSPLVWLLPGGLCWLMTKDASSDSQDDQYRRRG